MREHVVAAAKAMRNGEWKQCIQFLINDKMNAKVWDLMPQSTNVKTMLVEKVKEESLRTYLFRYSSVYESISIQNLAQMFDLLRPQVYSIISKMIINEELMVSSGQSSAKLTLSIVWLTSFACLTSRLHWTNRRRQLSCTELSQPSYKLLPCNSPRRSPT